MDIRFTSSGTLLASLTAVVAVAVADPASAATQANPLRYEVAERGADFKVMRSVRAVTNSYGQVASVTNKYTVLGNGMNRQDASGNWVECVPVVQSFPGGIICTGATYRVVLMTNLNRQGSVDFEMPDGQRIISHPLAIGYFDPESGRRVWLSQINDCRAQVTSNKVVYAKAFTNGGIEASVVFKYGVGRFHQDVVLTKRPAVTPADLGMGSRTRLEIGTEIIQAPVPARTTRVLKPEKDALVRSRMVEPDLSDETLAFTERIRMPLGYALPDNSTRTNMQRRVPVAKRLRTMADGRTLLIEAVEWRDVRAELEKLPRRFAVNTAPLDGKFFATTLPPKPASDNDGGTFDVRLRQAVKSGPVELAVATGTSPEGFVVDYEVVDSSMITLTPGTYFIDQAVYFGSLTYREDVVIKFSNYPYWYGGPCVLTVDSLNADSSYGYGNPIVFTSMDDDSVGVKIIEDSSVNPEIIYYAGLVLGGGYLAYGGTCRYLDTALTFQTTLPVAMSGWNFENCNVGLFQGEYGNLTLENGSFRNCGAALYQYTGSSAVFRNVTFGSHDFSGYSYIFCGINQSTTETNRFSCSLVPFAVANGDTLSAEASYRYDVYGYYSASQPSGVNLRWNGADAYWGSWPNGSSGNLGSVTESTSVAVSSLGLGGQTVTNLSVNYLEGGMSLISAQGLPTDMDNDGLPDLWEMQYFGYLDQAAGDDYDGDGYANLHEYQAGKNPNDPNSNPGDMDNDSLPDAWELAHFGNLNQTATGDYDGDGKSNLQEKQDGTDPNTTGFLVTFPDSYTSSTTPTGEAEVRGGHPNKMVWLVDTDPRILTAAQVNALSWLSCPAGTQAGSVLSVTPTLAADSWHTVWVGMKGSAADSKVTWNSVRVKVDRVAPVVHVTTPATTPATVPYRRVQIIGYAEEKLSKVTYDLSNSEESLSGVQAFVTSESEIRSDFQAFDLDLKSGEVNTVTLHVWDRAGNATTTTLTLQVDPNTPAPVDAGISWPADGTLIAGDTCSFVGSAGDPGSTVTATITDSLGSVTTLDGRVDRNGNYSIENVPVHAGQNTLSVAVTDGLGRTATTTRTVQRASYFVDPVVGDLRRLETTISGTISKLGAVPDIASVTVNGQSVTLNATTGQAWPAVTVPVNKDEAMFRVHVVLTPVSGPAVEWDQVYAKPAFVRVDTYDEEFAWSFGCDGSSVENSFTLVSWKDDIATTASDLWRSSGDNPWTVTTTFQLPRDRLLVTDTWDSFYAYYFGGSGNILAPGVAWTPSKPITYSGVDGGGNPVDLGITPYIFVQTVCASDAGSASVGANVYSLNVVGYFNSTLRIPVIPSAYRNVDLSLAESMGGSPNLTVPYRYKRKVNSTLVLETGGRPGEIIPIRLDLQLFTVDGEHYDMQGGSTLAAAAADVTLGDLEGKTDAQGHLWVMMKANSRRVVTPKLEGDVLKGVKAIEPTTGKEFAWADIKLTPVIPKAKLLVDLNRDGQISEGENPTKDSPFRFWVNDDDDPLGSDIGGTDIPNAALPDGVVVGGGPDAYVDGRRDLVDFFPVLLDIKELLAVLPRVQPGHTIKYKLKHAGGALNFVYSSVLRSHALDYQRKIVSTGFNDSFAQAPETAITHQITASGCELSSAFLDGIRDNDWGVILVEGRAASATPLLLAVERDGKTLVELELPLRLNGVESMFRHLNLRDGPDMPPDLPAKVSKSGGAGLPTRMADSDVSAFPDSLSNGKWLVFVHGYNVGAQPSRGWEAEMFKRFYWSGNKARFIGVDWLGNPKVEDIIADYHYAAMNSLPTAAKLTEKLNALPGAKTIVGHSMGCLVTSYAISDFALQVNNACLVDAAVASECYDGDSAEDIPDMAYAPWTREDDPSTPNYPRELWAADWHKRFLGGADARQTLTWKNRFTNAIPLIHNFYSSTEDVLGVWPDPPDADVVQSALFGFGSFAWVIQEKAKGKKVTLLGLSVTGSDYGGWGFNACDGYLTSYPVWYKINSGGLRVIKTPADIGAVTTDLLDGSKYNPLFKNGWGAFNGNNPSEIYVNADASLFTGPSWILGLYQPNQGSAIAADPAKRNQLLAEAIPALSPPTGQQPLTKLPQTRNYPMPNLFANKATWPSQRGVNQDTDTAIWLHSDLRDVAYLHTFKLFDKIVSVSISNQ